VLKVPLNTNQPNPNPVDLINCDKFWDNLFNGFDFAWIRIRRLNSAAALSRRL